METLQICNYRKMPCLLLACIACLPTHPYQAKLTLMSGHEISIDSAQELTVTVKMNGDRIWQGAPKRWHPWKIASGDVDSDGNPDLLIGVYKKSAKKPFPHHSIFVYNLFKKTVTKKWLGSSLGLEFDDFIISEPVGSQLPKLILNEIQLDGKRSVGKYEWMGFGFRKLGESEHFAKLSLVGVRNGLVEFIGDGKRRAY